MNNNPTIIPKHKKCRQWRLSFFKGLYKIMTRFLIFAIDKLLLLPKLVEGSDCL